MSYYEIRRHIGADGTISITVPPSLANTDVRIRIDPEANGALYPGARPPARELTPQEWNAFAAETAGSIPDFPEIDRPGPNDYEPREPLDS